MRWRSSWIWWRLLASPRDDWQSPRFLPGDIEAAIEALTRLPTVRMLAERARDAGVPYSAAVRLWAQRSDMAVEFALDIVKNREEADRCPRCGAKEKHYLTSNGRPLPHGYHQISIEGCTMCDEIKKQVRALPEKYQDDVIPRIRPRPPGEPWVKPNMM